MTKGVEPCAVKAASTVLNGGDEETYRKATRLVPTQPRFRQQLRPGVMCQESPRSWRLKGIGLRWFGCGHQQTLKRDAPAYLFKGTPNDG